MKDFRGKLGKKRIDLRWVDEGDASAGRILVKSDGKDDKDRQYLIKLNQNHTTATQFTTLAHELGHLSWGISDPTKLCRHRSDVSSPKRTKKSKRSLSRTSYASVTA